MKLCKWVSFKFSCSEGQPYYLPLNFGLEMIELLQICLPFVPFGQITIAPVFHQVLQLFGIETVLEANALEWLL